MKSEETSTNLGWNWQKFYRPCFESDSTVWEKNGKILTLVLIKTKSENERVKIDLIIFNIKICNIWNPENNIFSKLIIFQNMYIYNNSE